MKLRGTRNPLVAHWPKGIKAKGEVRSQWNNADTHNFSCLKMWVS